jgi:hypothetical protein
MKTIEVPFTYNQLSDMIYYLEWKLTEISEAGCDLEFPDIENTLQQLQETQDRLRVRTEEDYQLMMNNRAKQPTAEW